MKWILVYIDKNDYVELIPFSIESSAVGTAKRMPSRWCHVIDAATGKVIFNSVTYKDI